MMELIKYIGQDGGHFLGTCIILIIIFNGTAEIIKAFRRKPTLLDNFNKPTKRKKKTENVEEAKIMD